MAWMARSHNRALRHKDGRNQAPGPHSRRVNNAAGRDVGKHRLNYCSRGKYALGQSHLAQQVLQLQAVPVVSVQFLPM